MFSTVAFAETEVTSTGISEPVFYDSGYLGVTERERVLSALTDAQEKTGFHYGVLLCRNKQERESYLRRMENEDSILLAVWLDGSAYRYELFTYGEAYDELTDSEVDAILDADDVYDHIKGGWLADGVIAFASLSAEAAIPDPNAEAKHTVRVVVISILLALVCAGAAAGGVIYHYKKKLKAPIYPLNRFARMKLVDQGDTFITAHVTRVRVSSPSNSSGGGSSGGGGGGSRGSR